MSADGSGPERGAWRGQGVQVERVNAELARLHRAHQRAGRGHALTRTLNLIVAPSPPASGPVVDAALARLGAHSPSRTLILRRHDADRLDAEARLECELPAGAGRVGVCHDQVVLIADDSRLSHAGSLVAPLLLSDLPTVLWLPDPAAPRADGGLLERSQQILVDSVQDGAPMARLMELARKARVHDLAWGRLEYWRAATAVAFEPHERRALLPRITALEVGYGGKALAAATLLAGWIAARCGWRPERMERDGDRALARASRPDGAEVAISLTRDPCAGGCGGVETVTFAAGAERVALGRGAATTTLRDVFAEALQPLPSFARGYLDALRAAAAMLPNRPAPERA